jgi:serine-type D-Ala-D-Ala carboxypeptidase/endopeptidase (penicillin-binding protein 4)
MRLRLFFLAGLSTCCIQGFAQDLSMFRKKAYAQAEISISVVDLKNNKELVAYQTSPIVTPASVLKLVTTSVALERLGPDYRFKTLLMYTGNIKDGVLDGDVLIVGGGDPTLGSKQIPVDQDAFLTDWVGAIRSAGIRSITGRIISDPGAFDMEGVSPFWLWEDIGNYYATGVYGLNVYDNSFRLTLSSGAVGSKASIVDVQPEVPGLKIENNLIAAGNDQDSAYLYGAPFQMDMRLYGTMPAGRERFSIRGQLPNPPFFLADRLKKALFKAGINVSGNSEVIANAQSATNITGKLLYTTLSPPLRDVVRVIHEKSDNFYAECLLRCLASELGNKTATSGDGLRIVRDFWKNSGLDITPLFLYDACGLSPNDRVSARFLASMLAAVSTLKYGTVFEQTIPLVGVEGTVSGLLKNTPLEGRLRLKSGSNQSVLAYAGYYRAKGHAFAVAIIVNHAKESRSEIRKDIETFLLSL